MDRATALLTKTQKIEDAKIILDAIKSLNLRVAKLNGFTMFIVRQESVVKKRRV